MSGNAVNYPFWSPKVDEYQAADALRDFFNKFNQFQASRRTTIERYATVVEGMRLTSLGPWGYSYDCEEQQFFDDEIPIIRNVAHSLVDTLTSKIGAIDPPLPSMLTNKGSWRDRRQAADLEQLVRAEYAQPKGHHATLHECWIAALRLASGASGTVAVQYYPDNGGVGARIHDTLDMAWSPDLRVISSVTWLPVDDVVEMYPDSEDDIRNSVGEPPNEWSHPTYNGERLTDFVAVYEGWRGAGAKPGRYVVAVKNGPALKAVDYPHKKAPFVWLGCSPQMYGPLSHCLVHHIYESMRRDNLILSRVDRAINSTNESTVFVTKESLVNPDALTDTDDRKIVWIKSQNEVPTTVSAPGFAPEHLSVANNHYQDAHAISGLAESHTAGVRQEGVNSAIGQRYVAALINERFAALQRRYVQAVAVDSAEIIIQILCEIFEEDPKLMRLAPGQDTLKEISGSVALKGIEQLKYVVTAAAVSGNNGNPADRMQTAFELRQLNILTDDQLAAMQSQGYDLPAEVNERDVQRQWCEKQFYRWQFASDEEIKKPGFYIPPFEHMRLGQALLLCIDSYLEAQMDDLEPERLDFYFQFMGDCGALAAQKTSQEGQAPESAGLPSPPAPGNEGAPPGMTPLPQIQGI